MVAHDGVVMAPIKLLLVDDDRSLRDALAEQMCLFGLHAVTGVGTAKEVLELANQQHFDIILLDIGLPDMDGRIA